MLVTTKSYGTAGAVQALARFSKQSIFVSLQNGLGNEEILAERAENVLGAVINQGVTFLEPGAVYHAGEGETELGAFQEQSPVMPNVSPLRFARPVLKRARLTTSGPESGSKSSSTRP